MEVLKLGTVEPLLIGLRDRLENLSDLSLVPMRFDVRRKSDDQLISNDLVPGASDMTAICLIDTNIAGYSAGNTYKLYLKFDSGSEHPKLGPIFFRVEDD